MCGLYITSLYITLTSHLFSRQQQTSYIYCQPECNSQWALCTAVPSNLRGYQLRAIGPRRGPQDINEGTQAPNLLMVINHLNPADVAATMNETPTNICCCAEPLERGHKPYYKRLVTTDILVIETKKTAATLGVALIASQICAASLHVIGFL